MPQVWLAMGSESASLSRVGTASPSVLETVLVAAVSVDQVCRVVCALEWIGGLPALAFVSCFRYSGRRTTDRIARGVQRGP